MNMNTEVGNASSQLRAIEPSRFSPVVLSGVVGVIEAAMAVVIGLALLFLYPGEDAAEFLPRYEVAIVLATQIHIAAFSNTGLYSLPVLRRPLQFAGRAFL